jgi:hypothetical protein
MGLSRFGRLTVRLWATSFFSILLIGRPWRRGTIARCRSYGVVRGRALRRRALPSPSPPSQSFPTHGALAASRHRPFLLQRVRSPIRLRLSGMRSVGASTKLRLKFNARPAETDSLRSKFAVIEVCERTLCALTQAHLSRSANARL